MMDYFDQPDKDWFTPVAKNKDEKEKWEKTIQRLEESLFYSSSNGFRKQESTDKRSSIQPRGATVQKVAQ